MELPTDLQDLHEVERKKVEALASLRPLDASSSALGQYASYNLEVGLFNTMSFVFLYGYGNKTTTVTRRPISTISLSDSLA